MDENLSKIVARVDALDRVRRGIIRQTTSISNRIGGQLRGALGFHTGLPEKERKVIVDRAARIQKAILGGKTAILDEDALIAEVWRGTILATAEVSAPLDREMAKIKLAMSKAVRDLPGYDFAKSVAGFGDVGFAVITARCHGLNYEGLSDFSNPGKVWSRVGLAPTSDPIKFAIGKRPRSDVFQFIYDPVIRAQCRAGKVDKETGEVTPGRAIGPYGEVYAEAKARYMERVKATADLPAKVGEGDKARRNPHKWTPKRADMAARRYMAKRLLKNLWQAWREAVEAVEPRSLVLPAELIAEAAE